MLRVLKLLLLLLAVPVIGVATGVAIQHDLDRTRAATDGPVAQENQTRGQEGVTRRCAMTADGGAAGPAQRPDPCQLLAHSTRLQKVSFLVAAAGLGLPVVFSLGALLAGRNRRRMALIFPALVRISLLFLAVLSLLQGAVVAYAFYIGRHYLGDEVHVLALALIGFGTFYVFFVLLKNALTLGGKIETRIAGVVLPHEDYPKIHRVIALLAKRLGARRPDNVVAGLEPTFFVTSARVRLPEHKRPLRGETLFLSLPLCRLLSLQEFTAVVGHELGHFRGADTAYSLKFAPVYSGLGSAIQAMSDDRGRSTHLLAAPALEMLKFMYGIFAKREAAMSRARELAADRAACEVASVQALATSLLKVAMFGWLWDHIQQQNVARLQQGLVTRNLSMAFANTVQHDIDHDKVGVGVAELLEVEIPHPTDSHPTIKARLEALTGDVPDFSMADLRVPEENAVLVFDNFRAIEEQLTVLEHRIMVQAGIVHIPRDHEISEAQRFDAAVLNSVYAIVAALVTVDGRIDDQEIAVAEDICRRFLPNFQPVDFREYCYHPDQIPNHRETARFLARVTTARGRDIIIRLLRAVAEADSAPNTAEMQIIGDVQAQFAQGPPA